jgi:hypothetical protein
VPAEIKPMGLWKRTTPVLEIAEHLHFLGVLLDLLFDWKVWLWAALGGVVTLFSAAYDGRSVTDVLLAAALGIGIFAVMAAGILILSRSIKSRHQTASLISSQGDSVLEVIFDPTNPAQRFWSREAPRDENGNKQPGVFWEYRVAIKNNSQKTVRNVSVTVEHIGQNLPVRPVDAIFDKIRKTSCDLKPGADELVAIIRWPIPVVQAGMLANLSALEYGPVKVTASGDDVPPLCVFFNLTISLSQCCLTRLKPASGHSRMQLRNCTGISPRLRLGS